MFKRYLIPHHGNDYHPHLFRNSVVGVTIGAVILLLCLSLGGSLALNNQSFLGSIYATVLVELANQDRMASSLPTLSVSDTLAEAAELKIEHMIENGYFAHNSPDGKSPWHWILLSGYKFVYAGENLAVNFDESEEVQEAWMNSPSHRANILNGKFTEVGIAVREGTYEGKTVTYVVQMFGKPVKSAVASAQTQPVGATVNSAPSKPASAPALAAAEPSVPEVRGDALEITAEENDASGTSLFIAAKDPAAELADAQKPRLNAPRIQQNFFDKAVLQYPLALNIFYFILAALAFFGLTMLFIHKIHMKNPKAVAMAFILLFVITGAFYANKSTELFAIAISLYP